MAAAVAARRAEREAKATGLKGSVTLKKEDAIEDQDTVPPPIEERTPREEEDHVEKEFPAPIDTYP